MRAAHRRLGEKPILDDAGFGDCMAFRNELHQRGQRYVVGVAENTIVWPEPVCLEARSVPSDFKGRKPVRPRPGEEQWLLVQHK